MLALLGLELAVEPPLGGARSGTSGRPRGRTAGPASRGGRRGAGARRRRGPSSRHPRRRRPAPGRGSSRPGARRRDVAPRQRHHVAALHDRQARGTAAPAPGPSPRSRPRRARRTRVRRARSRGRDARPRRPPRTRARPRARATSVPPQAGQRPYGNAKPSDTFWHEAQVQIIALPAQQRCSVVARLEGAAALRAAGDGLSGAAAFFGAASSSTTTGHSFVCEVLLDRLRGPPARAEREDDGGAAGHDVAAREDAGQVRGLRLRVDVDVALVRGPRVPASSAR